MEAFERLSRPIGPVRRPFATEMLDRLREAIGDMGDGFFAGRVAEELDRLAPFVSPLPPHFACDELASISRNLMRAMTSQSLRCDCADAVHREVARLISLQERLRGPGPEELRDDLAITAVAVAAGEVC